MGTRSRTTVVTGTAMLLLGASATFGAGSATAAVAGGCGETVQGSPGESVSVNPAALLGVGPDSLVTIGSIPSSGSSTLSVTGALGLLAPACTVVAQAIQQVEQAAPAAVPVTDAVRGAVPGVLPARPAPEQPAPGQPPAQPGVVPVPGAPVPGAVPPPQFFGPFPVNFDMGALQRGVYDFGALSLYDYAELFAISPGAFGRLPSADLFGQSPQFGILGGEGGTTAKEDVAAAGRAQAVPTSSDERIALPVLVAMLMLSGVAAALIRSWKGKVRSAKS